LPTMPSSAWIRGRRLSPTAGAADGVMVFLRFL